MKHLLCLLTVVFLVSCDDAGEQGHSAPTKKMQEISNHAYLRSGVQMYFRSKATQAGLYPTTYSKWKDRIELARKEGRVTQYPSGIEHFDYERMQGLMLPMEQTPTANGEPVYFRCSKRMIKTSKIGGICSTLYYFKDQLQIHHRHAEKYLDRSEYFLERDLEYREQIEEFLNQNPEFYYDRIKRGE